MITGVYRQGTFPMTDRVQPPTHDEDAKTAESGEQPQDTAPEAPADAPEAEAESPAAQRRARLRKEIRAGMQRALKH